MHCFQCIKNLGYDGINITEIWFQQYLNGSEHGWHCHSGNFTNVYYLELPEGTPKTQLVNPYNQKDIIEVDVKEGDLLAFPSYVLHKAPKNLSDKRKTIISYNIDIVYSDEIYGKNIE
jgi:ectoine hydroxylase-related dioxygenase (phytanoyl-CoA dioxygenase family)